MMKMIQQIKFITTTYNSPYGTKEVATHIPNDTALYDMNGNVWGWTPDPYTASLGMNNTSDTVREDETGTINKTGIDPRN